MIITILEHLSMRSHLVISGVRVATFLGLYVVIGRKLIFETYKLHALIWYVIDGMCGDRRHEGNSCNILVDTLTKSYNCMSKRENFDSL